jgi:hypothetical protein
MSYFGNFFSKDSPTYDVIYYGAKGDGVTDDTAAFNAAISAWYAAGGGTIFVPSKNSIGTKAVYLIGGAIVFPNTGVFTPTQPPLRITSDGGPAFNGFWNDVNPATIGGPVLDMRYDGTDGLHLAKVDTRGAGFLEIDHISFADLGTDNLPFIATTSTTVFGHHCAFFGNPGHTGATSNHDAWVLGQNGYPATNASMTNGSNLLTVGAGDPPFTAAMLNWNVSVAGAGPAGAVLTNVTIASILSPTQVHLSAIALTSVSGTTANYWLSGTGDKHDAFQGYGTRLSDNFYSRIRRGVTFNQYANSVVIDNETYSTRCGSSDVISAPYYFSGVPGYGGSWGCIIRGGTVEVNNYKYVAALTLDDGFATFDSVQAWDPGVATYVAFLYSGANARQSTIIVGYGSVSGAIVAGPTAGTHTIINSGFGLSSLPGGLTGDIKTTGAVVAGAPAAASLSPGDLQAARAAGTGIVFLGNGTPAQTASLYAIANKIYLTPTNSLGTNVTVDANGQATAPSAVIAGSLVGGFAILQTGQVWGGGAGAPTAVAPKGSMYSRTDGGIGSTFYVSAGGGTWNAVAGV